MEELLLDKTVSLLALVTMDIEKGDVTRLSSDNITFLFRLADKSNYDDPKLVIKGTVYISTDSEKWIYWGIITYIGEKGNATKITEMGFPCLSYTSEGLKDKYVYTKISSTKDVLCNVVISENK